MSQIPSLQTLLAFDAAARLRSYTKAGEELGLTHSAISHRIRDLEERLGKRLFQREGNSMQMTPDGQKLAVLVRQALSLLDRAFPDPKLANAEARPVIVTSVSILASTWLYSRLSEFRRAHPEIDVELRVSNALDDYRKDHIDLGVRLGAGGWPGFNAVKLFDEALTPVCTAEYRDRLELREPADLARATLLRNDATPWARWFRAAGLDWPEPRKGPAFNDPLLLLRAAFEGEGVALARHWLAVDGIRQGLLVFPFDIEVPDLFSYWLVWPTRGTLHPAAETLRDWLIARAADERAHIRT